MVMTLGHCVQVRGSVLRGYARPPPHQCGVEPELHSNPEGVSMCFLLPVIDNTAMIIQILKVKLTSSKC